MKLEANLDTNVTNMRKQCARLLEVVEQAQRAIGQLQEVIAAADAVPAVREATLKRNNEQRAAKGLPPIGVVRYPPWCTSKAAQQTYLKQLSRGKKLAANRRAKEYSSEL